MTSGSNDGRSGLRHDNAQRTVNERDTLHYAAVFAVIGIGRRAIRFYRYRDAVEIAKISVLGFSAPVCRLACHGTDASHVTVVARGLLPNLREAMEWIVIVS